jgi:hypothetical protein
METETTKKERKERIKRVHVTVFCEVHHHLVLRPFISKLHTNLYHFLICALLTPFGWFIPIYLRVFLRRWGEYHLLFMSTFFSEKNHYGVKQTSGVILDTFATKHKHCCFYTYAYDRKTVRESQCKTKLVPHISLAV